MTDSVQPDPSRPIASAPLYDLRGVLVGTLLGSLAGGVVLVYLNYLALGKAELARSVAIWGSGLFLGLILIGSFTPGNLTVALLSLVVQLVIAWFLTDRLQGDAIRYHEAQGGAMHGLGRAAAVGFLTGLAIFFLFLLVGMFFVALTGTVPAPQPG
ncbi:MAG: hypothetical protein AAGE43_11025 [Pseudomonadota bacterium]